jgi:hypothetical protein
VNSQYNNNKIKKEKKKKETPICQSKKENKKPE